MKSTDQTILYVNPVPRQSAQGRHLQQYLTLNPSTGEIRPSDRGQMQKVAEDSVTHSYSFPINPTTSRLETGLDVLIVNPFKGFTGADIMSEYTLSPEWLTVIDSLVEQDKIKKQTYFEILAGVEPDLYTSKITGGTVFSKGWSSADWKDSQERSYLQTFKVILYPRPNRFTSETPRGRLALELVKIHNKIANSKDIYNPNLHNFFVSEENESQRRENDKRKLVTEAHYYSYKLQSQETPFRRYQVAITLKDAANHSIVKGDVSDERVVNAIDKFIEDSNPKQYENIEKFLEISKGMETVKGIERFKVQYLIQQAFNSNVLSANDGYILWHSKADKANVSKFTDETKLLTFLLKEFKKYNPKEKEGTNWYKELYDEVKAKGIKLDD